MKTPRRKLRQAIREQVKRSPSGDTLGIVRTFIRSPGEAVVIARSVGSPLVADLNSMLGAARELVAMDNYDIIEEVTSQAQLDWQCAFQNVQNRLHYTLKEQKSTDTQEVLNLMTDLAGIWRIAITYVSTQGVDGTMEYLTDWVDE